MRYLPHDSPDSEVAALEFLPADPAASTRRFGFAELTHWTERYAALLHAHGIGAGDRVCLYLDNSPELVVALFGNQLLGAVTVPVNPAQTDEELTWIVRRAGASVLLTDREVALDPPQDGSDDSGSPGEGSAAPRGPAGAEGGGSADVGEPPWTIRADELWGRLEEVVDYSRVRFPESHDPETPALLVFTSGTTGKPKGVELSHRNLRSNLRDLIEVWGWTASDVLLLSLPLFHVHGLGLGLHGWAMTGCAVRMMQRFDAARVLELLTAGPATMFFGVPTMYRRLVEAHDASRHDLTRLRLAVTGSAAMPVELHERCRALFGQTLVERYGMTETVMNASNTLERRRPGTVGFPLPSVDLRIVALEEGEARQTGAEVVDRAGEVGEIQVRGPNVFSGYYRDPEATAAAFVDGPGGWFHTGDLGRWDEDGFLCHMGRAAVDFIKSGGHRIGAREVEEVLERHSAVGEAAVVGVPDEEWGECVTAFIVRADAGTAETTATANGVRDRAPGESSEELIEHLVAHCRAHLAPYKLPRSIHFVDALPKNAMGKVDKLALAERVEFTEVDRHGR